MNAHTIKKALGLFVVYALIIIGIFILQFSADSIISEKIGSLQISLSKNTDENAIYELKNDLLISFNGISLSCDDSTPAFIVAADSMVKENVQIIDWEKTSDLSYKFIFTKNIEMNVSLTNDTDKATFVVGVDLPEEVMDFYIPYTLASNLDITSQSATKILYSNKKTNWEFSVPSMQEKFLHFTSNSAIASCSYYEETVEFKFAVLQDSSTSSAYEQAVSSFRNSIVSSFKSNNADVLASEQAVVAYVAEQASRGNYITAIEEIPQSVKRSETRTYLSAPYFNTLEAANATLEADIRTKDLLIRQAYDSRTFDVFTVRNITNNMYIYPSSLVIKTLLERAGEADVEELTLAECAGILRTYVEMSPLSEAYARHLEPVLPACVAKIEKACKMEGVNLTISENGTFLSVVQAVEIGDALLRYGQYVGDASAITGGKALIASYIGESAAFDVRTLSDLYPVVVRNNTYYPHFVKLKVSGDDVTWAWTVARSITCETATDRSVTYTIDFPLEHTHHIILRGVPAFRGIFIYDMAYRTDPRFETYNSSGYVYKTDTKALLLKSRHKSEVETVRLTYYVEQPKPVEPVEVPETPEETESESGESEGATES